MQHTFRFAAKVSLGLATCSYHSSMLGDKQVFIAWKAASLKLLWRLPACSSKFEAQEQCSHEQTCNIMQLNDTDYWAFKSS